jgi:putative glycerol-1-phosphate prenyltransferase
MNLLSCILVGGSLLTYDHLDETLEAIKSQADIPVILFPGSILQLNEKADAVLLLSLISGRNADLLIGKHVIAAPYLKNSSLEILPTGYMLIESGPVTTAQYISNTIPIPRLKDDIAICTAIAGEMLGLRLIYMDAGSGAEMPVSTMISKVKANITIPYCRWRNPNPESQGKLQPGADMIRGQMLLKRIIPALKK